MIRLPCRDFLGFPVTDVSISRLIDSLEHAIVNGPTMQVVTLNPEMIAHQSRDAEFQRILLKADVLIADGSGIILASRFLGVPIRHKIPGVELVDAICRAGSERGWRVYLLGGTAESVEKAAARTRERFPQLPLAGWHHGYFTDENSLIREINHRKAQVVLVGLGSPRQEEWIDRHRLALGGRVLVGVGGSFDVIGGTKRRAPLVFRHLHLEWFWRVAKEPRRLKRVIPAFCRFGWLVLSRRLGKKNPSSPRARE